MMSGEDDSLLYSCVLCSDITQEKARKEEAANGRKDKQFRVRPTSMARIIVCRGKHRFLLVQTMMSSSDAVLGE